MPNQRILLIEDDAAIRQGVADALRYTGYHTLEAGNVPDPGAMTMLRPPSLPCFAAGLLAAPAAATSPASARGRSPGLPPSPSRPQA